MSLLKYLFVLAALGTSCYAASLFDDNCYDWMTSDGTDCGTYLAGVYQLRRKAMEHQMQKLGQVEASDQICCTDGTGCFTNAKGTPWQCFPFLPDCMDKIKPQFFLYTPENTDGQTIDYNNLNSSIQAVDINNKRPFFVEIHGYGESWPKQWLFDMKDSLVALVSDTAIYLLFFYHYQGEKRF